MAALTNNQLVGYGYDSAGNMRHDATNGLDYSYDQENRIIGAAGYTYAYDADGNRVAKSNGSTGMIYWYMAPGIVAESDLTGALKSEYVFFDGERVARKDFPGNSVFYYFSDHLKTASVITDSVGNIKEDEDYYPWGGELQFVNSDSNHYKFTGKERDTETGLDYFGARYYGNWLGRFITPDWAAKPASVPYADLADPQSLNLYSFVWNLPTTKIDVNGHQISDMGRALIQPALDQDPKHGSGSHEVPSVLTGQTASEVVKEGADVLGKGVEYVGTAVLFLDFSGLGNAAVSIARKDPVGALLSVALVHVPGGGGIGTAEAKSLLGSWSKGTLNTVADSLRYHFAEHGAEVGAKNIWQYMRKAAGFKQNLKGATTAALDNGATRYMKKGQYIILDKSRKILSYGKQR